MPSARPFDIPHEQDYCGTFSARTINEMPRECQNSRIDVDNICSINRICIRRDFIIFIQMRHIDAEYTFANCFINTLLLILQRLIDDRNRPSEGEKRSN